MADIGKQLSETYNVSSKVGLLLQKRLQLAQKRFSERVAKVSAEQQARASAKPASPWDLWSSWTQYATDLGQRTVLFWDALRQRGNQYLEHVQAGSPPVLHFDYEMVLDARGFQRPVNYALVRIVPPEGVTVDPKRRPYVVIDPRAGHGPGIGGFKDDSQVGVALREGHPVYFVIFFPQPAPGQTLLDVCAAESRFVRRVRELHPDSPKPAIVGNCQGGWSAMMVASSSPEDTGPIVINGAPMSYWGGAWSDGAGDNPMRYSGGLLGGSWLSSLTADLGNGLFDGAHLVQNFENLNPANTFWDKYYHLYANVDTELPRFLEFERWWGGFYLMNREEIEWIVQNLFVGNKLWSGEQVAHEGKLFDLREIRSPIILFASMGDNITPPQQAFNWVADVYGSTDEIKSRGQVIVGLLHEDIGHLGIFVSGKVAKKEHAQIVSVLQSIEALPPGLYGMKIGEVRDAAGKVSYEVEFVEHRLEEISARLNRFKRGDERPFEAVAAVSDFNQRAYELFAQPLVQAMSNEFGAQLGRRFHPLRFQRWAVSDLNPWLAWLKPAADMVRAQRKALGKDHPLRQAESAASEVLSASLDYYRDVRDALSEAQFFQTFGSMFALRMGEKHEEAAQLVEGRELPFVQEALASIAEGGYVEALTRAAYLLQRRGQPMALATLQLRADLLEEYRDLLPAIEPHERRRIRGEQEIICRYEPERALETLPKLLSDAGDRARFVALLDRLVADPRVMAGGVTSEQRATYERIKGVVSAAAGGGPRLAAAA